MNENKVNLMKQLFRMNVLMHRYQSYIFRTYGPFGNPHRGQGRILSLLKIKPEISQKELSYLLDMRSQSLGELLVKLERNGLITRTPSQADRRVMEIKLTAEGEKIAIQSEQHKMDDNKLFNCLNEEEQAKFAEYLSRIIDELKKKLGQDDICGRDFGGPWSEKGHFPPFPHPFDKMRDSFPFDKCFCDEDDQTDEETDKDNKN